MKNVIIDLFSGAGGFGLGAYEAGFTPSLSVDYDRDITSSVNINFPQARLVHSDLAQLPPNELLKLAEVKRGELAGVIGGPPCQGFSYIGKRNADDPRNHFVTRYFQYVDHARPHFFVMENVPGLLSTRMYPILSAGIDLLSGSYQILEPMVLNASDYGAATSRPRVFIVGFRKEYVDRVTIDEFQRGQVSAPATVRDAIHDLPELSHLSAEQDEWAWAAYSSVPCSNYAQAARQPPPTNLSSDSIREQLQHGRISGSQPTRHTPDVMARFAIVQPGKTDSVSRCRRLMWTECCPTLRAGTGRERGSFQALRPIHPKEDRVITVREAARLQGFPDWFQFHPTKWHSFRMIGNSVSPYVSRAILTLIGSKLGIQPQVT